MHQVEWTNPDVDFTILILTLHQKRAKNNVILFNFYTLRQEDFLTFLFQNLTVFSLCIIIIFLGEFHFEFVTCQL